VQCEICDVARGINSFIKIIIIIILYCPQFYVVRLSLFVRSSLVLLFVFRSSFVVRLLFVCSFVICSLVVHLSSVVSHSFVLRLTTSLAMADCYVPPHPNSSSSMSCCCCSSSISSSVSSVGQYQ
jgi:hypothetical protein